MLKTIPLAGQYGVIKDTPAWELPLNAWSDARNVSFANGSMKRIDGQLQIFELPTVTPHFVIPYQTATARYWVHCGLASVFADDGTGRTDITGTPFTGTSADRWTGGVLNGILGLTNGVDLPVYWDGNTGNNLATLPAWDSNHRCSVLVPFKVFWIALDITKSGTHYPYMVKWSSAADPGANPASWDETDVTLDAGEQDLGETGDLLMDAKPLGDALIIYKENSRIAMRQTFDARVFSFQRLPGTLGALSRNCVAEVPGLGHAVFGNGDIYAHGGGEPVSLCDSVTRQFIFNGIDTTSAALSFAVANTPKNEVWFCYPETGETTCTLAAVYNYVSKTWTFRELPGLLHGATGLLNYTPDDSIDSVTTTIDVYSRIYDRDSYSSSVPVLILASDTPRLDIADVSGSFGDTEFTAYVERTGMVLTGDPSQVVLLTKIVPRIEAAVGTEVLIEAGGSMSAESEPEWTFSYTYTVGSDPGEAYGFASGKFISVRFSSDVSGTWKVKSFDLEFEPAGKY